MTELSSNPTLAASADRPDPPERDRPAAGPIVLVDDARDGERRPVDRRTAASTAGRPNRPSPSARSSSSRARHSIAFRSSARIAVAKCSPRASTTAVGRFASVSPSFSRAAAAHASEMIAMCASSRMIGERRHVPPSWPVIESLGRGRTASADADGASADWSDRSDCSGRGWSRSRPRRDEERGSDRTGGSDGHRTDHIGSSRAEFSR